MAEYEELKLTFFAGRQLRRWSDEISAAAQASRGRDGSTIARAHAAGEIAALRDVMRRSL